MAADAEDKHLTIHMIPINLTMVQEAAPPRLVLLHRADFTPAHQLLSPISGLVTRKRLPGRGRRALMRELWNLYGEAVEATQSFVDVDDVAAIPDALDG